MSIIANYHTHTYLCNHATGDVFDYIKHAIKYNYEEIGMSCHAPHVIDYYSKEDNLKLHIFKNMTYKEFNDIYLAQLEESIKKYGDKISIKKGLESEYVADLEDHYKALRQKVDYLILGQHFFSYNNKIIDSYDVLSDDEIIAYATTICRGLDTKLYKILAHPDVFMVSQPKFNEACKKACIMMIESCIKNNVYFEINCNGKGRYPYKEFFEIVAGYKDLLLIVGVDAHEPSRLHGSHIDDVYKFISQLDLKVQDKVIF